MTPDLDDVDWAMGELFQLIQEAKDSGSVPWHLDWDLFWACMRVVYAQDHSEQRPLIRMLLDSIGERPAIARYFAHAYARPR